MRAIGVLLVFGISLTPLHVPAQSPALASISVQVQTFGKAHADFPATIQIHSPALESDLSATVDKPSNPVFPNLPPGDYRMVVSSADLTPAQLDLSLTAGQSVELSLILDHLFPLVLKPQPGSAPVAAPVGELPIPESKLDRLGSLLPTTLDLGTPDLAPVPEMGSCSLEDVLPHVSAHAREFVDNVNRITATEVLELERRRRNGKVEETLHNKVTYVANIQMVESKYLSVDEYRNGFPASSGFIKAVGSPALVLVFHPLHVNEFDITCRGVVTWQGAPAYLLRFQQRPDRPNNMSEFRTRKGSWTVSLKGTAWVDVSTFQVVHLETDLVHPVPELFLDSEHQSLDYGPVVFSARHVKLWLPQSVAISVHVGGKEFNAWHQYSNYQLFVVDTGQKIDQPKEVSD